MVEFYKGNIPIIDIDEPKGRDLDMLFPKGKTFDLVKRDFLLFPQTMFSPPSEMKIIEVHEWDARFDEQEELKSSLEHIYLSGPNGTPAFVNLDQGTEGYCWIYSCVQSMLMDRLRRNLPFIRLNPHSAGAIIKKGANEGGWCGEGADFLTKIGCSPEGNGSGQWPKWSRDYRRLYNEAMKAEMAKYRIDEQWVDLSRPVWGRNLMMDAVATCGFLNIPGPRDYNWWGHSVCGFRWVRIERGSWGQMILNSWLDWGRFGLAVLRGNKSRCDGAMAIRSTSA